MKVPKWLTLKSSNKSFWFYYFILKIFGCGHFTVKKQRNGKLEMYRTWMDYLMIFLNVALSLYVFYTFLDPLEMQLRSEVLNMATKISMRISIASAFISKMITLVLVQDVYRLFYRLMDIDSKVKLIQLN